MKQREIWLADLNPVTGSEQRGFRPVVIVSGDVLNQYMDIVIACPFTSKIKKLKGNQIMHPTEQNGLEKVSELVTFQIRSLSKRRLVEKIGMISQEELQTLKKHLNEILSY